MSVLIRAWKTEDAIELVNLANNKKIWSNVKDFFPHPYTKQNAKEWLALNVGVQPVMNFVIEADGSFAGSIGMIQQQDVHRCNMEIGYWLGEPYWNKGYVTKAIELICEIIWRDYSHINRIIAEVFEHNTASMKALEKNGFALESIQKEGVIKNDVLLNSYLYVKFLGK